MNKYGGTTFQLVNTVGDVRTACKLSAQTLKAVFCEGGDEIVIMKRFVLAPCGWQQKHIVVNAGDWQSGAALEADGVAAAATLCAGGAQGTAAGIYGNLWSCHLQMRQYDRAIALYEQTRAAFSAAGDRAGFGRACCDLGFCHGKMGQYDRAIVLHEQARAAFLAAGDRAGVGQASKNLEASYNSMERARAASDATGAYPALSDIPTNPDLRGTCANCGDSVLSTQNRRKHPNGDYYHTDPKDCPWAPMTGHG